MDWPEAQAACNQFSGDAFDDCLFDVCTSTEPELFVGLTAIYEEVTKRENRMPHLHPSAT